MPDDCWTEDLLPEALDEPRMITLDDNPWGVTHLLGSGSVP
jgi:hypothetical protein